MEKGVEQCGGIEGKGGREGLRLGNSVMGSGKRGQRKGFRGFGLWYSSERGYEIFCERDEGGTGDMILCCGVKVVVIIDK